MLEQLPPDAARVFENLIKRQHRSDRRHAEHRADFEEEFSSMSGSQAHWTHGPGGGRRRPRHAPHD